MPNFFAEWLKRSGADLGYAPLSSGQILFAARNGDAICSEFVSEVSKINSRGLSSVVCAYNPDVIVLDGPLAREYADLLIGDFGGYLRCPQVCVTELEGNAPLMGAGAYALRNLKDGKG
jgi:glucokinase